MSVWTEWSFEPGIIAPIVFSGVLYAIGGRGSRGASRRQTACFWAGFLLLAIALVSPVDLISEHLFFAHMTQHEILMLAAAPLFVLSRPLVPMLWASPLGVRRAIGGLAKTPPVERLWHWITRPLAAWSIHAAAIWIWHFPPLFDATLESDWVHGAQHLSFFLSALLFWWSVFHVRSYGVGVISIFTTAVHTSILGALLTFSRAPWYRAYIATAPNWGFTPLQDQQIGGLIMWVPAGVVYLAAGLFCLAMWLRQSDALAIRSGYAG